MWLTPLLFVAASFVKAQDGNTTAPVRSIQHHNSILIVLLQRQVTMLLHASRLILGHSIPKLPIPVQFHQTLLQQS